MRKRMLVVVDATTLNNAEAERSTKNTKNNAVASIVAEIKGYTKDDFVCLVYNKAQEPIKEIKEDLIGDAGPKTIIFKYTNKYNLENFKKFISEEMKNIGEIELVGFNPDTTMVSVVCAIKSVFTTNILVSKALCIKARNERAFITGIDVLTVNGVSFKE